MIHKDAILYWSEISPFADNVQVEQDLLLTGMLCKIYSHPVLSEKIAFRGGTCLQKLFMPNVFRYSEDLDFVQIQKEPIGDTIHTLRDVLSNIFEEDPAWAMRRDGCRLYYFFQAEGRESKQKIKIEINTREQFSIEGYQKKELSFTSPWISGEAQVTTFSLEEILATKLRALYQRKKGRDLFDLWKSKELKPGWEKVVHIFMKYMEKNKHPIHRDEMISNLHTKLSDKRFLSDIGPLLVEGAQYEVGKAAHFVEQKILSFVPESRVKQKKRKHRLKQ
ncbi:MAG: nucleotidyl transferase AbiEii/AbiGii toxin family protein [Deltaproteobacteria bacterium CG_4_9_14_0_2_um_filter_42_21]|nr:MAG: nucleotidyl transferase AbiEii/AbiGii toxin family protein [Deltaproteobacteria bacterium CG_4_9_14_0_2_um_filter_42_21]